MLVGGKISNADVVIQVKGMKLLSRPVVQVEKLATDQLLLPLT